MVDVILRMLNGYLTQDFIEYNARNYQDYTITALLNLASYAYDDRVRLAARMVLDYVSAKMAVSSENLRRSAPYRRRNEDEHYGPILKNGFLGTELVYNNPPHEFEPGIAFYTMLVGNTQILHNQLDPDVAPGDYRFEMVHAGLVNSPGSTVYSRSLFRFAAASPVCSEVLALLC